jgi:hypothetical protein
VESLTCVEIDENRVIMSYFVSFVGIAEGRRVAVLGFREF